MVFLLDSIMVRDQPRPREMGDTLIFVSGIGRRLLRAHICRWLPSNILNKKDKIYNWLQGSAKSVGDIGARGIAQDISALN